MKKFLLLFAALLTLGMTARAADGDVFTVDNLTYQVLSETEHKVSLIGFVEYPYGDLSIPAEVNNNGNRYSVTDIGESAFSYCSGLTSVTIPNSVTGIGEGAFANCDGLTSVTIPNSVTEIGAAVFTACSSMQEITVEDGNDNYTSIDGVLYDSRITELITYPAGKEGAFEIPNSVIGIGESAFKHCWGLTSVTIPNSVTNLGESAFSYCSGLTSVTIPNSVTNIGESVFSGCEGLTSVDIPNSVTAIGEGAFANCSGLTSVTIPNSVTAIGEGAFANCSGLTSVTIPNSVTNIGESAFFNCTGLTSVTISNSVTAIREGAFSYCSGLTSVTIPNSVTDIGECAFYGCSGLTSVTIPSSVTGIGDWAFAHCTDLTTIIAQPTTPPACFTYTFKGVPQSAVVYIPKGTLNEYSSAEGWNYFTDFRETEDSGIEGVEAGSDTASAEFFRLNGMRVKGGALAPGVYLKRQGGKTAKVLVR